MRFASSAYQQQPLNLYQWPSSDRGMKLKPGQVLLALDLDQTVINQDTARQQLEECLYNFVKKMFEAFSRTVDFGKLVEGALRHMFDDNVKGQFFDAFIKGIKDVAGKEAGTMFAASYAELLETLEKEDQLKELKTEFNTFFGEESEDGFLSEMRRAKEIAELEKDDLKVGEGDDEVTVFPEMIGLINAAVISGMPVAFISNGTPEHVENADKQIQSLLSKRAQKKIKSTGLLYAYGVERDKYEYRAKPKTAMPDELLERLRNEKKIKPCHIIFAGDLPTDVECAKNLADTRKEDVQGVQALWRRLLFTKDSRNKVPEQYHCDDIGKFGDAIAQHIPKFAKQWNRLRQENSGKKGWKDGFMYWLNLIGLGGCFGHQYQPLS